MNKADKELAQQAWTENDWEGHVDIPKLIQLVRADEREACAKVCDDLYRAWTLEEDEDEIEPPDAIDCKLAIQARGNT
jgi:hypothetical protein